VGGFGHHDAVVALPTLPEGALRARQALAEVLDRSRADELDELHRRLQPARHRSLLLAWAGSWLRRASRPVAEPLPAVTTGEVGLTWIGHAGVVARYSRLVVVLDPNLETRSGAARRAVSPGLAVGELQDVGLVLISNGEPDHLVPATLRRLPRTATVVVPPRCAQVVSPLGFARVVELGIGQSFAHRGVEIASAPVRHVSPSGRGACAWLVRGDGPSLYFAGATGYGAHFGDAGRRFRPDVAILPIGGYWPRALRADFMSPLDAIYAFEDLQARLLMPIRHGTFVRSYERLDEPLRWLGQLVNERGLGDHVAALPPGASRKFAVAAPSRAEARSSQPPPVVRAATFTDAAFADAAIVDLERAPGKGEAPAPAEAPASLPQSTRRTATIPGLPPIPTPPAAPELLPSTVAPSPEPGDRDRKGDEDDGRFS
jgi:L-ascorbate metabolism protein UlaG (beta-lactamase superfamily)